MRLVRVSVTFLSGWARLSRFGFLIALLGPFVSHAETILPEELRLTVAEAFFHVAVTGDATDGNEPKRWGKAFAISPNLLITSRHVVGDPHEWKLTTTGKPEVDRAARSLNRQIQLARAVEVKEHETANFIQPAPSHTIDAAGVFAPGLDLERYFHLSMCEIKEGESYNAIMTVSKDPKTSDSVSAVEMVELKAADFKPAEYGPLYVFDTVGNPTFTPDRDGHDGSPILNKEWDVIAIVSAVTTDGNIHRILATPIEGLFPGINSILSRAADWGTAVDDSLACSLADTVKRIHDEVSSHAIWNAVAKRDNEGRLNDVYLSYENIAKEPNIASITVAYSFHGVDLPGAFADTNSPAERISFQDPGGGQLKISEKTSEDPRKFVTHEIGRIGRDLVEPHVRERAGANGRIDFVRLQIIPIFENPLINGKKAVLELPWTRGPE
jgi:hypothetical protein